MDKVFKIATLISNDIRSRANANIIRSAIDGIDGCITLDFSGVVFASRSFVDELFNIKEEHGNINITNASDLISSMLSAVSEGRKHKRNFNKDNSEIKEFDDMESLSAFLLSM